MHSKAITVLGATGGLGREVVNRALKLGHQVRAHVRSPSKLTLEHERLQVFRGDLADPDSIREAVQGSDAVISCVGYASGTDPGAYGEGLQHVLDAMDAAGVTRLIAISGAGLQLEGDETGLGRRIIIGLLRLFAARTLAGKQAEWEVIRESEVDWTVVRVARMVDRPGQGRVSVDLHRVSGSPLIAYADVAAWMIEQLDDETYRRHAPFISEG